MNSVVRDYRRCRNPQPTVTPQVSKGGGNQRIGRDDQVRLLSTHDLEQPVREEQAYGESHNSRARSSRGHGEDGAQGLWRIPRLATITLVQQPAQSITHHPEPVSRRYAMTG